MKKGSENDEERIDDLFHPADKHAQSTKRLVSLFELLNQLGWMIASEDPNISNTFQLRNKTEVRIGKTRISRKNLNAYLETISDKRFLYRNDHLVIWREIPPAPPRKKSLTRREREIYELLLGGMTHVEIASDLGISPRTVDKHIQHIYEKQGVTSYNELMFALR